MKKRGLGVVATLLILFGAALWSFDADPISPDPQDDSEKLLPDALTNLSKPDKISKRQAVRQISRLLNDADIDTAIEPLSDVLLEKTGRSGIFTQQQAAVTLGLIAATLGIPKGDPALEPLIDSLDGCKFDIVRAAAAQGLGISKNDLALAPLKFSLENDHSILVKYAAREALISLARNGIQLPEDDPSTYPDIDEAMLHEYLRAHVLYSNPPLQEVEGKP